MSRPLPGSRRRLPCLASRSRRHWLAGGLAALLGGMFSRRAGAQVPAASARPPPQRPATEPPAPERPAVERSLPTVHPARVPPPFVRQYELTRGSLSGTGELAWEPAPGGSYRLRLEARMAFVGAVLTQESRGLTGGQGLEPQRFADRRLRRPERVASFERQAARISFSGGESAQALLPGTQDRLSWMVQLGAMAQARPAAVRQGSRLALWVASARGDVEQWVFRSEGLQALRLGRRQVEALRLVREARHAEDPPAEIWLDPARHHLPLRARWSEAGQEPLELLLQSAT